MLYFKVTVASFVGFDLNCQNIIQITKKTSNPPIGIWNLSYRKNEKKYGLLFVLVPVLGQDEDRREDEAPDGVGV